MKPQSPYLFALPVKADGAFNLNLLPGLSVQLLHTDVRSCENPSLDRGRVQVITHEHVVDPWRLAVAPVAGKNPIGSLYSYSLAVPNQILSDTWSCAFS